VLLRHDVSQVVAVDVGYGQLAWPLQQDSRVVVLDRTNVRSLSTELIGGPVDLVVGDLSFISLTTVLPVLVTLLAAGGDLVLMVKPQFEVGKERLGKGGVVRDVELRVSAIESVADKAQELGFGCRGVSASPLPGPAGNVEYFVWLRADAPPLEPAQARLVVESGPE
jgi:23S rRNA (cytidine1920-2'-O)/16S rRNA (cytidine1409-2'-O)-methyltransferase